MSLDIHIKRKKGFALITEQRVLNGEVTFVSTLWSGLSK